MVHPEPMARLAPMAPPVAKAAEPVVRAAADGSPCPSFAPVGPTTFFLAQARVNAVLVPCNYTSVGVIVDAIGLVMAHLQRIRRAVHRPPRNRW